MSSKIFAYQKHITCMVVVGIIIIAGLLYMSNSGGCGCQKEFITYAPEVEMFDIQQKINKLKGKEGLDPSEKAVRIQMN